VPSTEKFNTLKDFAELERVSWEFPEGLPYFPEGVPLLVYTRLFPLPYFPEGVPLLVYTRLFPVA